MKQISKKVNDVELYRRLQKSPVLFCEVMWGLIPERDNTKFIKGKHISWQQHDVLLAVEKALRGEGQYKISVASGHGIGKSAVLSWLIIWYLFCYKDAQVPCTAPTADQMYDVLWKELNLWINRLPDPVKKKYVWESSHVRISEAPQTWFARAKTASKENTEALAGIHADYVMIIGDEASGIYEQVFNTAEGSMTAKNTLVVLCSNPTRIDGYFYDTHHKLKDNWQHLQFSSLESPLVDPLYEAKIAERHGRDSDEYGIRVLGKFPKEDAMDDSGYIPLLAESSIHTQPNLGLGNIFPSHAVLGVDPSGEGDDKTSWVLRDSIKAKKIAEERISNPKSIAERTMTFITHYNLSPENVVIDNFGPGADVAKEIAIASRGQMIVTTVNVGDPCDSESDQETYLNKRAEYFYKSKIWLQSGGEIVENTNFKDELMSIRYKRNLKGKIQIMSKVDMRKKYGAKSPNDADALSLTFAKEITNDNWQSQQEIIDGLDFDQYSVL